MCACVCVRALVSVCVYVCVCDNCATVVISVSFRDKWQPKVKNDMIMLLLNTLLLEFPL